MKLRPAKSSAVSCAINFAPKYAELLSYLHSNNQGLAFDPEIQEIQNKISNYVVVYDDERKIGILFFLAVMGDEGYKDFKDSLNSFTDDERQEFIDYIAQDKDNIFIEAASSFEIPQTPEEWKEARELVNALPEEERKTLEKQGLYYWAFFFSSFLNFLSLMIHGTKLTTLVQRALTGDDEAFLKAVQIDRQLLISFPYFKNRKLKAQTELDTDFLRKLSYRESISPLKGKIRFPALYMVFGILEAFGWLHELKHSEILDICDEAKLDRFQNRIEDVNYLSKRLKDYRDWQKLHGKSMP